jgi:hypothetical protein
MWFLLVPDSKAALAPYFNGNLDAVPDAIEVELVQAIDEFNGVAPFPSWQSVCPTQRLLFASPGRPSHPFDQKGVYGEDWAVLFLHDRAQVEVTGPLVVDIAQATALGEGYLEIHPVESITVLKFPDATGGTLK